MPPLTLEGDTLGQKHQHYNKLVDDAINNKSYEIKPINGDDSDIDNLLKIDIASKTRNVNFIIETLKCNDMLYVSRVIKKSTWLITDPQYANIINPEYLHTQLFPSMNTRAVNKLMLHIRLNLKDESRVETFYSYLKNTGESYKWLQNCSIPFIENVVKNTPSVPLSFLERFCKRSINFLQYYPKERYYGRVRTEILIFLKSHTDDVLKILEDQERNCRPAIGKKNTEFLMKTCPQRIIDNFEKYIDCIELSVFAKYLKKDEIKAFLYKHMNNKNLDTTLTYYTVLKHFVTRIPKEERVHFVKKHFIDKTYKRSPEELETLCFEEETNYIRCTMPETYVWYEHLPFNVAFADLKKLIRAENSPTERCAMLLVLIKCAKHSPENINTLLKYFYEKHINEAFKFKIQFVNNFLIEVSTHDLDNETWNILDQLFHSMEVYTESEKKVELCLKSIVLYKVLHDEKIPAIVEKKIAFTTFKKAQKKLNQEQKDKMFSYLLNSVLAKIRNQNIANESDFNEIVFLIRNALTLLIDWKKNINNYPFVIDKIQELIKIKKDNSWETELSELYNMNKSWRRHMFEESLSLCLHEETCLNALKHKPQLLTRHHEDLDTLRTNEAVSLKRLFAKIRVYWSNSLTQHWTNAYLQNLNNTTTGQKAQIKGLFQLLPQKQLLDLAKRHVPEDFKVNWGETDQAEISIRKNIAQNLHIARPLIPLDAVLWYAKGDYLQYAVPSLNAVIHYISKVESREHLIKLLDGPVSLQKFGIHLAFSKLQLKDLQPIFSQVWNSTKNSTIRYVIFKHTFTLICTVKNETAEKQLWELLSAFIDNLTAYEMKQIYEILGSVKNVPNSIKAQFYMKSYNFLTSLPDKANCERYVNNLLRCVSSVMVSLDEDFVVEKILSPTVTKFCTSRLHTEFFASFVICGNTEEEQLQRFRKALDPVMEHTLQSWNSVRDEEYYIKDNFNSFLHNLVLNFRKYVTFYSTNRIPIPVKLFTEIKTLIEGKLPLLENYVMYTSWRLITEYIKLMGEHNSSFSVFESTKLSECDIGRDWMPDEIENLWKQIHHEISPTLGPVIVKCLKEDTDQYFSSTCLLFGHAFEKMISELPYLDDACMLDTIKYMLNDDDSHPSYILVSNVIPKHVAQEQKRLQSEIRRKIILHPSKEVRMHYYWAFQDIP